jgi:hypothetical protein
VSTVDGWIVNFFPYPGNLVKLETLYDRAVNPPERGKFSNGPGNSNSETSFFYYNLPKMCHLE